MKRRDFSVFVFGLGLIPALMPGKFVAEPLDRMRAVRRVLRNLPEAELVGLDRFRLYRERGWRFPAWLGDLLRQAPPGLEKQLETRVQADLTGERVTRSAGWLLAETEADLAMVLVLARRNMGQGLRTI